MAGEGARRLWDLSSSFCNLFAVWIGLASAVALRRPDAFAWLGPATTTRLLVVLSFSVGMTTKPAEFVVSFSKPRPVAINAAACFLLVPAAAVALSWFAGLPQELLVGMVLLGSVNGGSTSNLCALIAGADVPLSVLMTSSTTLMAVLATPLIPKFVLGAIVPIDAGGILVSALQVVLLPVCLGVLSNSVAPRLCRLLAPLVPVAGVASGAAIIGAIVGRSAGPILDAGLPLHLTVAGLHLIAGIAGYSLAAASGGDGRECRTVAFEVAMKNCAFASVLAAEHFEAPAIRAPAAASCIWCPLLASALAVFWKLNPVRSKDKVLDDDGSWSVQYGA